MITTSCTLNTSYYRNIQELKYTGAVAEAIQTYENNGGCPEVCRQFEGLDSSQLAVAGNNRPQVAGLIIKNFLQNMAVEDFKYMVTHCAQVKDECVGTKEHPFPRDIITALNNADFYPKLDEQTLLDIADTYGYGYELLLGLCKSIIDDPAIRASQPLPLETIEDLRTALVDSLEVGLSSGFPRTGLIRIKDYVNIKEKKLETVEDLGATLVEYLKIELSVGLPETRLIRIPFVNTNEGKSAYRVFRQQVERVRAKYEEAAEQIGKAVGQAEKVMVQLQQVAEKPNIGEEEKQTLENIVQLTNNAKLAYENASRVKEEVEKGILQAVRQMQKNYQNPQDNTFPQEIEYAQKISDIISKLGLPEDYQNDIVQAVENLYKNKRYERMYYLIEAFSSNKLGSSPPALSPENTNTANNLRTILENFSVLNTSKVIQCIKSLSFNQTVFDKVIALCKPVKNSGALNDDNSHYMQLIRDLEELKWKGHSINRGLI